MTGNNDSGHASMAATSVPSTRRSIAKIVSPPSRADHFAVEFQVATLNDGRPNLEPQM